MNRDEFTYEFDKQLEQFLAEFETVLREESIAGHNIDDSWKGARNQCIRKYWVVDTCYATHGIEKDLSKADQSFYAGMGRKVAGAMYTTMENLKNEAPGKIEPKNGVIPYGLPVAKDTTGKRRFTTVGPIFDMPTNHKQKTYSSELVERLSTVKKGQGTYFEYGSKIDAVNDQQLMGHATMNAGWYKGLGPKLRPFKTRIKAIGSSTWRLEVFRLEEPIKIK